LIARDDAIAGVVAAHGALRRQRLRHTWIGGGALCVALAASSWISEVRPDRLVEGIGGALDYLDRTLPRATGGGVVADVQEWYWGLGRWVVLLFDTVVIGALATLMGGAAAFVLSFLAARNLVRSAALCFVTRRLLEFARAVPELVFALIFVFAFGIGPLAGVLAIAIHTAGALGKLFSEVNENADHGPIEGLRATGANWLQSVGFGVVPQVLPVFLSYTLLRFEINVRGAAIVGFVGAGGIGQELYLVIRQFIYPDIGAIVLLIIVTVTVIDLCSERLRHAIIGRENLA
jgi:phosphonate transport system permease protein